MYSIDYEIEPPKLVDKINLSRESLSNENVIKPKSDSDSSFHSGDVSNSWLVESNFSDPMKAPLPADSQRPNSENNDDIEIQENENNCRSMFKSQGSYGPKKSLFHKKY